MDFNIILRTCDKVPCWSGRPRIIDSPKSSIINKCVTSIAKSINRYHMKNDPFFKILFTVVDDFSTQETIDNLHFILNNTELEDDPEFVLSDEHMGNGKSIEKCYNLGLNKKGLVYFVEDDYLHAPLAITNILDTYRIMMSTYGKDISKLAVHPLDDPDRYSLAGSKELRNIYRASDRFWRTVRHTTGTFVVPVDVLKTYWNSFIKFSEYGITPGVSEDNSINLVWNEIECIAPMPTLAVHLQYKHTISPFIDWRNWWDSTNDFEK